MIILRKITGDNFNECMKLEVNEEQKSFVASNTRSLAQAYIALTNYECIPMPYAIYKNDINVGFIMLSYDETEKAYWVWRLMIDKRYRCNKISIIRNCFSSHYLYNVKVICILNRRMLYV